MNYIETMRINANEVVERRTVSSKESKTWTSSENSEEYQSVYEFDSIDFSKNKIRGPLFFDLDTNLSTRRQYNELKRQVRKLYECFAKWNVSNSEIELFFSGSKGFHFVIPAEVLKINFREDWNYVNRVFAEILKNDYGVSLIDLAVYDKRRMLRLPGSINYKSRLYKIPLSFAEFDKISLKQLRELAKIKPREYLPEKHNVNQDAAEAFHAYVKKIRAKKKRNEKKKESAPITFSSSVNLLPCIEKAIRSDCPVGKRDTTAFLIASFFLQRKTDVAKIRKVLTKWNKNLTEPLNPLKLWHIVNDACKNDAKAKNHYGCGIFREEGLCAENCSLKQAI